MVKTCWFVSLLREDANHAFICKSAHVRQTITLSKTLALIFVMLLTSRAIAQKKEDMAIVESPLEKKLSPQEMTTDIEALVNVLEEAHPFLHEYNPKDIWYKLIAEARRSIKDSLSQFAFYRLITPLVVSIHEEHTYIAPSQVLEKAHQARKQILPFQVFVIQNRVYIDSSYTKEAFLPRGTEVLSINGRSVETILEEIRAQANFATGTETDFATSILNRGFNFAMGYSYFLDDKSEFDITYQLPSSQTMLTYHIKGIINPYPEKTFPHWNNEQEPFCLQYHSDSIVYLKISSFARKDESKFYHKAFAEMKEKQVKHLVVDLRDNSGGNPRMASELLRYFIPTSFVPIAYSQLETQSVTASRNLRNPVNFKISKSSLKCREGKLIVRHMGLYKKHTPRKNVFTGQVYFLMNAKCASATTLFLALADHYKIGLLIGENPSGNYEYVCGHQLAQFTLPNADFSVQMPLQKSKINTTSQGRKYGVKPDYYVPDKLEDVLTEQDTQFKFVLDLIGSRKN